ncbi:epoxide hydrolase family protein [Jatrophihabitans sp.]|uniref:epoxide hydrolase family protein n=1 Tax=Jatrophihabitans sp. TaxID=1932789 RepID=UPI0030C6616F|nr:epoxide hydrolase [Jatrophihabitans sp.]
MALTPRVPLAPFTVDVPQATLDDLQQRLRATRWDSDPDNEDGYYGVSTSYLRGLVDYWIDGFDWRAQERHINRREQYRQDVDGVPVHFFVEPGKGPAPIPIILSHGWPWSFLDWDHVVSALADPVAHGGRAEDAFDVVLPSLPGFGYSTPTSPDMNFWKIADIWKTLMTDVLGCDRFAAAGSDYGSLVTGQLGHKYADSLYGIHIGMDLPLDRYNSEQYWGGGRVIPADASPELRAAYLRYFETYASHFSAHMLDGQTLTHALNDSPVGLLAWLVQRWRKWSDQRRDFDAVFDRDHVLANATLYWVTGCIGPSIRLYRNSVRYPWAPAHDRRPPIEAPAGFTFLAGDAYPPGATVETRVERFETGPTREWFNPVMVEVAPEGGHFTAWENPEATVEGIRKTMRELRVEH